MGILYRPNSAKVKNLKTKDYLGRARLVAASDKANAFTGFAGVENKRVGEIAVPKDDRPTENISFAASNLVRPDIQSRARQQSAPPINRNLFPPTPPPDSDQNKPQPPAPLSVNTAPPAFKQPTARASSVRNGQQPVQRIPQAPAPASPRSAVQQERPRLGTVRTASEPRGPASRYAGTRSQRPGRDSGENQEDSREAPRSNQGRLFRETTRRGDDDGDADVDEYPDELYDLYRNTAHSNPYAPKGSSQRARSRSRQRAPPTDYIDELDEEASPSLHSSLDEFEILNNAGGTLSRPMRDESRNRASSRREKDVRTVRVKVHAGEDTRYLMVSTTIMYEEFLDRVRDKLSLKDRFKVKIKDEGDLITMGDRDDWELAIQTVRRQARKDSADMGKMEVCLFILEWKLCDQPLIRIQVWASEL